MGRAFLPVAGGGNDVGLVGSVGAQLRKPVALSNLRYSSNHRGWAVTFAAPGFLFLLHWLLAHNTSKSDA